MDNCTTPKYNLKKHTRHDSPWSGSQFTRCIPLSKRETKIKKSGRISRVRQVYFTSKSWRRINPFKRTFLITSQVNSTMRPFFIIQTSGRICSFLPYLNLQFCRFSQFCKTNCTHSISIMIKARASFAQQIIALTTL